MKDCNSNFEKIEYSNKSKITKVQTNIVTLLWTTLNSKEQLAVCLRYVYCIDMYLLITKLYTINI